MLTKKSPLTSPGILVSVEGPDGIGKSTQIQLLRQRLEASGNTISEFDFPSKHGTPIGELVGSFLRGEFGSVQAEFLSLAFSLDRASKRNEIRQALEIGAIVLCDRYVLSNIAFQRSKASTAEEATRIESLINWVEYSCLELPYPDIEIILFAPNTYFERGLHLSRNSDLNRKYVGKNADIHESSSDLQMQVNSWYKATPELNRRVHICICESNGNRKDPDRLHEEIYSEIEKSIPTSTML